MFAPSTLTKLSSIFIGSAIATLSFAGISRAATLYEARLIFNAPSYPFQFHFPFSAARSIGRDINEAGEVVGIYEIGLYSRHYDAFLWSPTTGIQPLSAPTGKRYVDGNALNDAGIAVGSSLGPIPQTYALLWDGGAEPQILPNFPPINPSFPFDTGYLNDINNQGQIVGSANGGRAALWENGGIVDLGIFGTATAINESAWIVGNTDNTGAFLWNNGQISDLGDLNVANDINDLGQIVGTSTCGSSTCASIWENGTLTQFGLNTVATGINNLGWAVGYEKVDSNDWQRSARLWKDGSAIDLNSLIDPSLGWTLLEATAINDKGQIVGTTLVPDPTPAGFRYTHAFVLTPIEEPTSVPEPTTLLGLAVLGAGLAFSRRDRH